MAITQLKKEDLSERKIGKKEFAWGKSKVMIINNYFSMDEYKYDFEGVA